MSSCADLCPSKEFVIVSTFEYYVLQMTQMCHCNRQMLIHCFSSYLAGISSWTSMLICTGEIALP